ncbi:GntR family transcriptional regulator [Microbacterium oleivorans]|uniref:GntR family transcriptional regulator n=1 Tax=Microbacterium oleivorans TaxID=273677 RepID=UPI00203E1A7F|nr:GntR family transcriptional regulator [Microbacterium oleivorans]MCM3695864.1 GntR family transcriptional regulator [Microbacterium oleivorans]
MPVPSTSLPPRGLLRDEVRARLCDAIVDGTLAPGEQLRDAELATWLGVSRTPVREALLDLARSGLVLALPGRSTVVAPVDDRKVRDAAAVVASMHRIAVVEATHRLTDEDIERMRLANDAFIAAHDAGDTTAALEADHEFHAVAVERADNDAVRTVLALYGPVLERAERLRFASSDAETSAARHAELIRHCAARDAHAAAAVAEGLWLDLLTDTTPQETP